MTCANILAEWAGFGAPPDNNSQGEISLQWADPLSGDAAEAAVRPELGQTRFTLAPAFPLEVERTGRSAFWILAFPDLTAVNTEKLAFEAARCLQSNSGLASARPVLIDSLIGVAAATPKAPPGVSADAIFGGFCSSKDGGPDERGWAPFGLGILGAWKLTRGAGVTVASIDTGSSDHAQLAGVFSTQKAHLNLVEGGSDARDRFSTDVLLANPGHGTLVASVVASRGTIDAGARTEDDKAVTGTAPDAHILPIRAIRSVIDIRQSTVPAAIEHAIAQNCDVIIMALGSAFSIEPVEAALRRAAAAGIVTVCAAGNCYGPVVFPAKMAHLGLATAVAAVDHAYQPWEKTSKGPEVTVSAFGEAVWGARQRAKAASDEVARSQGTTLASSLTAGIAALWVAHHGPTVLRETAARRGVTVQRLFNEAVQKSAYRPSGWPRGMGAGLINADALLNQPIDGPSIPSDVSATGSGVTPLSRFLPAAVAEADSLAGQQAGLIAEPFAAEALWRFYTASARDRARASGMQTPPADPSGRDGRGRTSDFDQRVQSLSRLDALL